MAKATKQDLMRRARNAIEGRETVCFEVCAETSQSFDNVKAMRWFLYAVANELIATTVRFAHLTPMG